MQRLRTLGAGERDAGLGDLDAEILLETVQTGAVRTSEEAREVVQCEVRTAQGTLVESIRVIRSIHKHSRGGARNRFYSLLYIMARVVSFWAWNMVFSTFT